MRRRALRLLALLGFAAVLLGTAGAGAAETDTLVANRQAWFATGSGCAPDLVPGGCPAVSPYPAGTLHVAASGGTTTAVSALAFDATALPLDATVTAARLVLHVDPATTSGSANVTAAMIEVCALAEAFAPDEGSTEEPPACRGDSVSAALTAASDSVVADVTVFVAAWARGESGHGLLVHPAAGAAPTDTWHVALRGTDAGDVVAPHILATLEGRGDVPGSAILGGGVVDPPPGFGADLVPLPALPEPPVARLATPASPTAGALGPAKFVRVGYAYPALWLAPLVLLLVAGLTGWALTKEICLPGESSR